MTENGEGDIPDRLKRLPKLAAPEQFADHLRKYIWSRPRRGRLSGWFLRPIPVALAVAVGAIVVAVFVAVPYFSVTPLDPQNSAIPVPSERRIEHISGQNSSEKGELPARSQIDTLSADSSSMIGKDVNTSKLP
jgi:hypothetical protein